MRTQSALRTRGRCAIALAAALAALLASAAVALLLYASAYINAD
ncbi:MAG TPA: hypothetical protein VNE00_19755 [Paraburkholderia sp.]|jgi:hypothetical protein|nr:hypothetical protein [Paraburkholderia sp.]